MTTGKRPTRQITPLGLTAEMEGHASCKVVGTLGGYEERSFLLDLQGIVGRSSSFYRNTSGIYHDVVPELNRRLLTIANPKVDDRRLLLARMPTSRLAALVNEVLGVGVGLAVAEVVFGVPYSYWFPTPKNGPFDFEATYAGRTYCLETRGWQDPEKARLRKAFTTKCANRGKVGTFHQTLMSVFVPQYAGTTRRDYDLFLIDPEQDGPLADERQGRRSLLRHYVEFFRQQGLSFGDELARFDSDEGFAAYEQVGVPRDSEGLFRSFRNSRTVEGIRYVGTNWTSDNWPFVEPTDRLGLEVLIGLREDFVTALVAGNLDPLATGVPSGYVEEEDFRALLLPDGVAFVLYRPEAQEPADRDHLVRRLTLPDQREGSDPPEGLREALEGLIDPNSPLGLVADWEESGQRGGLYCVPIRANFGGGDHFGIMTAVHELQGELDALGYSVHLEAVDD